MISTQKGIGVFAWQRLLLAIAWLLVLNGVFRWFTTPREEDPRLSARSGNVVVIFPGSTPAEAERLVVKPIEDELAKVEEIKEIRTRIRTDLSFFEIELKDTVASDRTEVAWDKVQRALDRAQLELPDTVWKPDLNREIFDQDAIFLTLYGGADRLQLYDLARALKDKLQLHPRVKSVDEVSSPGEQLSILLDYKKIGRQGVSIANFLNQLKGGNANVPSGYVRLGDRKVSVVTNSFYKSAEELRKFPVVLKSGETHLLSEVASVSRTTALPVRESMLFNGREALGIGVVPQKKVNLQAFGEDIRKIVDEFKNTEAFKKSGAKIEEVSFQPRYVEERIHEIGLDLLKAILLVGGTLMLMLGVRVGSLVAIQVPLVTAIAFGIFSQLGGIIHQISIAAFILAIGLLVDNVVVIVDGIQSKLDQGLDPVEAGERTRKEYLIPLLAGTLTTIAAFLPMLIAEGSVADFTRDIGVVSALGLGGSYLFCIFITPLLAAKMLKRGKAREWSFVVPLGEWLGRLVHSHPRLISIIALAAVSIAMLGFGFVKKQFFPNADRDLVIMDVQLPEGTHYQTTKEITQRLDEAIRKDKRVVSVASVIGRGVPPFYYNLPREPNAPHVAQMIVRTLDAKSAIAFKKEKQDELSALVPFGTLIARELSQGPPVKAPIEVRVFSDDPLKLQEAAQNVFAVVREAKGIAKVRSTLGVGALDYKLDVNDSAAGLYGLTRAEVSAVILSRTAGVPATTFRGGTDPYAMTLISKQNENSTFSELEESYLGSTRTDDITVKTLVHSGFQFGPSVLERMNRTPVVYIYGELADGYSENDVAAGTAKQLKTLDREEGVRIELGGAMEESKDSQKKIFAVLPTAMFLLLISLLFEFNSFRRIGIILLTIPLCVVGAVPGLLVTGSTFGFMTLLGLFALAGTVIHNGIFLLDYIDHRRNEGVPLDQAITEGIQRRMRPIILTAAATIVELLPMTMSSSTLWPPFAWVIITGLSVSTLMTLLVIPSVYKLSFQKEARI
ncbi:MAG: efflux RND transporter permease subunit [Elusimicrobia bacterium]|nr:efflux RND transporter permease subunit [Elusimicrobiota bacterium]